MGEDCGSPLAPIVAMSKPRILVLAAAGRTGMPVALQLLDEGFPVTALVHQVDRRSERLKTKGAEW
jgi:NAD(P)H dehydrogenase (quinone)